MVSDCKGNKCDYVLDEKNVDSFMKSLSHNYILTILASKKRTNFLEAMKKHNYEIRVMKK
ncbi:MAG TPA: hypothetical protein ENH85_02385 [Candidatus Scalindua sp.]|nr:hypothetical protein [Candidatus Scalindua sp.]